MYRTHHNSPEDELIAEEDAARAEKWNRLSATNREWEGRGVVYFVQAGIGGPIKIGRTDDMVSRLSGLQTACPVKLHLLAVREENIFFREELCHSYFWDCHLRGEWFSPEPELLGLIRLLRTGRPVDGIESPEEYMQYAANRLRKRKGAG